MSLKFDGARPANIENYIWKYKPSMERNKYVYLFLYTGGASLSSYMAPKDSTDLLFCEKKIKALLNSYKTAKIDVSSYDCQELVLPALYAKYESSRKSAMEKLAKEGTAPPHYDILSKIHELVIEIENKDLKNKTQKIRYNIFGTKTGRMTNLEDSFPILTLPKKERVSLVPQNDLFVELDFNGAEIRTLLALSGTDQPSGDIHRWNMNEMPPWISRPEAKEEFFAWLYNPSEENIAFDKFYDKSVYKKYWDGGIVTTPFHREIKVDERKALNYLLQSTTSDLVLENAHKIMLELVGKKSYISFVMHDSIVLDYSKEDTGFLGRIIDLFKTTRLGNYRVSTKIGKDFFNMKEISDV